MHLLCFVSCAFAYRYRVWGPKRIPRSGPVLFVANHQSFLDPILVGLGSHSRQFYAMARVTLWRNQLLGWLIGTLNAIPIDQSKGDMTALRRCIEVLKQGQALLVFPEGSRTSDGALTPFAPGVLLLIKRTKPTVVPVAIRGAFAAWPRVRRIPRLSGHIDVMFGQPIQADHLLSMGSDRALAELHSTVDAMWQGSDRT